MDNLSPQMRDNRKLFEEAYSEYKNVWGLVDSYDIWQGRWDAFQRAIKTLTTEDELEIKVKPIKTTTHKGTFKYIGEGKPLITNTTENELKLGTLDEMFSDLPPRTDWQELRMAFTVWRCNLKGKIRNWLNKED